MKCKECNDAGIDECDECGEEFRHGSKAVCLYLIDMNYHVHVSCLNEIAKKVKLE